MLSRHTAQPETDKQTASQTAKATRALVAQHRNRPMKIAMCIDKLRMYRLTIELHRDRTQMQWLQL